jgi:hypothetical protein
MRLDRFAQPPSAQMDQAAAPYKITAYFQIQGDLLGGLWAAVAADASPLIAFNVYQEFEDTPKQWQGGDAPRWLAHPGRPCKQNLGLVQ